MDEWTVGHKDADALSLDVLMCANPSGCVSRDLSLLLDCLANYPIVELTARNVDFSPHVQSLELLILRSRTLRILRLGGACSLSLSLSLPPICTGLPPVSIGALILVPHGGLHACAFLQLMMMMVVLLLLLHVCCCCCCCYGCFRLVDCAMWWPHPVNNLPVSFFERLSDLLMATEESSTEEEREFARSSQLCNLGDECVNLLLSS
mgnify:CR=1 FL=1